MHGQEDLAQFRDRLKILRETLGPPTQPGAYEAHTDGSCLSNPAGPGGWAAVVEHLGAAAAEPWELWGHLTSTSNNRAEALGLLAALEWVPTGSALLVWSDSELTVRVFSGAYKAKANLDVWAEIRRAVDEKKLTARTEWLRGHVGHAGNERADALSVLGSVNGDVERWERLRGARDVAESRPVPDALAGLQPRGDWEKKFVASVAQQIRAGRALSDKQQVILARIRGHTT